MPEDQNRTKERSLSDNDVHSEMVDILEKLYRVLALYPPEHANCKVIAEEFLQKHKRLGANSILLDVNLILSQHSQEPGITKFLDAMSALGIVKTRIDGDVSVEELIDFVQHLKDQKTQTDAGKSFTQFDSSGLPRTIKVFQQEFGRRVVLKEAEAFNASQIESAVTTSLRALEQQQLDPEKYQACQGMIQNIFSKVVERVKLPSQDSAGERQGLGRSLEDVLDLGVTVVKHALDQLCSEKQETPDIKNLFSYAEKAVALSEDKDSVKIMLDVLSQAAKESKKDQQVLDLRRDDNRLSMDELLTKIDQCCSQNGLRQDFVPEDHSETLSVYLQILLKCPVLKMVNNIARKINLLLNREVLPKERKVLLEAGRELIKRKDLVLLDRTLPLILNPFRKKGSEALAMFFLELGEDLSEQEMACLWPHLVNEILAGKLNTTRSLQNHLNKLVSHVSEDAMLEGLKRLERFEAMAQNMISKSIFTPPAPALMPVLSLLLNSTKEDVIGSYLLHGFQTFPTEGPPGVALRMLRVYTPQHRFFFSQLLQDYNDGITSGSLREATRDTIIWALKELPKENRGDLAVLDSIKALGKLGGHGETKTILQQVVKDRKNLFCHAWPSPCRKAAKAALEGFKRY